MTEFSISFWYFGELNYNPAENREIIILDNQSDNPYQQYVIYIKQHTRFLIVYAHKSDIPGSDIQLTTSLTIDDQKWTHIVVTTTVPGSKK